jgi:hypothetical protein
MLFELTKRDVDFLWDFRCRQAFEAIKKELVDVPGLIQPNFKKHFFLDVD